MIAGQAASALGDKDDLYGGIGRNGAQKTPEAVDETLLADRTDYSFEAGKLYSLHADAVIEDHGDICKNAIAQAILVAVATTE
ncbi:MAG TPA: hypothetical protein VGW38_11140 [Chloroflexota bacterium]|nr:hypothetical protein [Chloroflexota bacterium]